MSVMEVTFGWERKRTSGGPNSDGVVKIPTQAKIGLEWGTRPEVGHAGLVRFFVTAVDDTGKLSAYEVAVASRLVRPVPGRDLSWDGAGLSTAPGAGARFRKKHI